MVLGIERDSDRLPGWLNGPARLHGKGLGVDHYHIISFFIVVVDRSLAVRDWLFYGSAQVDGLDHGVLHRIDDRRILAVAIERKYQFRCRIIGQRIGDLRSEEHTSEL